ncbi:hypothetical protein BDZ97DRAFT_1753716 [Flammula alnicola]|nr:hypothetical protein BDZ97DRAFT_1753716 [Flammula alnicola]
MLSFLFLLYGAHTIIGTINALPMSVLVHNGGSLDVSIPSDAQTNNLRSRLDIIWSCFATIIACTWVAVHPNIPAQGDSEWKVLGQRLKIMAYTLLVPELILYWANRGWTKTHGFFIGMGGFTLCDNEGTTGRPVDMEYLEDAVALGEMDWPDISEEDILDKSNGDYFTKGVVVLQTTWFVVQCLARGIMGLAITELELVTLAFAALNGAMYFFWWNKPLDVRRPIQIHRKGGGGLQFFKNVIELDEIKILSPVALSPKLDHQPESHEAIFEQPSVRVRLSRQPHSRRTRSHSPTLSHRISSSYPDRQSFISSVPHKSTQDLLPEKQPASSPRLPSISYPLRILPPLTTSNSSDPVFPDSDLQPSRRGRVYYYSNPNVTAQKKRWNLLATCRNAVVYPIQTFINDLYELKDSGHILSNRVSPFYAASRLTLSHWLSILLFTFGTIFGGIHCIAWSLEFPSVPEKWLWRSTSMIITTFPAILVVHWAIINAWIAKAHIPSGKFTFSLSGLAEFARYIWHVTTGPRLSIILGLYIISRIALLVLPLLSLRSLPTTAYYGIDWTAFIPHV